MSEDKPEAEPPDTLLQPVSYKEIAQAGSQLERESSDATEKVSPIPWVRSDDDDKELRPVPWDGEKQ